jgi:hypothetical protein
MKKMNGLLLTVVIATALAGCYADKSSVQARSGAPEPAQVAALNIPYDEGLPRFVLAVEPLQFADSISEWVDRDQGTTTKADSRSFHNDGRNDYGNTSDASASGELHNRGGERDFSNNQGQATNQQKSERTEAPQTQGAPGVWKVSETDAPQDKPPAKGSIKEGYNDVSVQGKGTKVDRGTALSHSGGSSREQGKVTTERNRYQSQKFTKVDRRAHEIAAQFISALSSVKNFSVRDIRSVKDLGQGRYQVPLHEGEVGPFVVRALITEYNTSVVNESTKVNAITLVKTKNQLQEGVVALDITVLDGRSGEIVASFPVQGTFSSRDDRFGTGIIIPFYEQKQFIQSVLAQAQRVALNDAAKKTFEILAEQNRHGN